MNLNMDMPNSMQPIGDEPNDTKTYQMSTCPNRGGRGYIFDSMGNRYDCVPCGGTGQVPD